MFSLRNLLRYQIIIPFLFVSFIYSIVWTFTAITTISDNQQRNQVTSTASNNHLSSKRILYIDSYNEGYEWSDGITQGIKSVLANTGITFQVFHMDTKRYPQESFAKQAALKAKTVIEEFKPDLVIISDDNAMKYILVPYFKNASIPFVFCGINWDASMYEGIPFNNTTGMIEVAPISQLMQMLQPYAKGTRLGVISADNETERKEIFYYQQNLNRPMDVRFVKIFEEWQQQFIDLQKNADMVIVGNYGSMETWNKDEAYTFMAQNTRVPTGAVYEFMAPYSLISLVKIAHEQGIWSAQTALRILNGTPPLTVPITQNTESKLFVNMEIARNLGIVLEPSMLKNAEIIKEH